MSTVHEVAALAGVSTATVSRALRGLPNVAPSTRNRVIEVAEQLQYAITPAVSRLASGRKTIAVIVPLIDQWFYSKLVSVIELALLADSCDVVRYSVESIAQQEDLLHNLTARKLVDALILGSLSLTAQTVAIVSNAGLPVFTVETQTANISSVMVDNVAAAELATRHLINLGHRDIGLISGLDHPSLQFMLTQQRRRGYQLALKRSNIPLRPELDVPGDYLYEGGAEAMKQLFSVHDPPTAVFALSDEMAIGALRTLRDLNLRAPQDISVIGFDDNDVSEYIGLTTIMQPVGDYGEIAAQEIVRQLELGAAYEPVNRDLQCQLVVRATTGPRQS